MVEQLVLSEWIRRQRALRDLTQEALAEEVGCAVQTIRAFENGWRRPSRQLAGRLASILGVPPAEQAAFMQAARTPVVRGRVTDEQPATTPDYASYLGQLVAEAHDWLYGPQQQLWLDRLDADYDSLQAALAWALDDHQPPRAAQIELGLRAASLIERFWHGRGHQAEGQRWLEQGINLVERYKLEVAPAVLAAALGSAGWLAKIRNDRVQAVALLQRCLLLYRALGDALGTSETLDTLGDLAIFEGDAMAATWFHEESLALRRHLGRPGLVALSLHGIGHAEIVRGYYERAAERFIESLEFLRDLRDQRSTALGHHGLGLAYLRQGKLEAAAEHLSTALGLFHALDNSMDVGLCLELCGELIAMQVFIGGTDDSLLAMAAQVWATSERLLTEFDVNLSPSDLIRRDGLLTAARRRVGAERFQTEWNTGAALSQELAVLVAQTALRGLY